jgi:4-hydroxybenzoate polyprenyltransferase
MVSQPAFTRYIRVLRHFISTRAPEVVVLQASPILGIVLGGVTLKQIFESDNFFRLSMLLVGSLALTAQIFVFNDWVETSSDVRDSRKTALVFTSRGILKSDVAHFLIALLLLAILAFALVSRLALTLGVVIAILGFLYSSSSFFGKHTPIMGTINHLLGGAVHFFLGYTAIQAFDIRGLLISCFFGLVFAGGHLNQEVRDYEGDQRNGISTNAVVFGNRATFFASLFTFSCAYAVIIYLASIGLLPRLLLISTLLWACHLAWSLKALQNGLGYETSVWMQRRYRLLFAIIGLIILISPV